MNDPVFVRRFERLGDLFRDGQRLVDRDRPARNALRQVLALDEFHHQRTDTVGFFETVDLRDVGMIQRGEGLGFAREPCEPFGVARERVRQDFDRDVAIQLRIARPIHLAHTPGPKGGKDFVRAKACAGVEGQTAAVEYTGRAARRLHYFWVTSCKVVEMLVTIVLVALLARPYGLMGICFALAFLRR